MPFQRPQSTRTVTRGAQGVRPVAFVVLPVGVPPHHPRPPTHPPTRPQVQDFTQSELLLDISVAADPNGLFYCGDTAQTIARGIGFRFADIRTLFYEVRTHMHTHPSLHLPSSPGTGPS